MVIFAGPSPLTRFNSCADTDSNPRNPPETDSQFSEPGLFVINPEGKAHVIDISNAPFARPDLAQVLNGIKFAREKKFPVRGTVD